MEEASQFFLQAILLARSYDNQVVLVSPFGPFFEAGKVEGADLALLEAISEELWERREQIKKQIRKLEVMDVVDVSPQDYFPTVIMEYLNAKKKGGTGQV